MNRHQAVHIGCSISVLALLSMTVPADAASSGSDPSQPQSKQAGRTTPEGSGTTIPRPDDCAHIKDGTAGGTSQSAAQKDCERSQHLSGGTGTSSGTGSGKRQSGSGPR
jgi:hypothetical protein